eukprot:CAMPEP_0119561250 /NCGR_PEP_ID=MMETSP1352-20130426/17128_1 /TAXON_ID=265584 /ORGANISM="Stauroneis constricta, Strain CCMP1120" /LENGTH=40 /DNA_ID= /DNA_START= /DNA_END= /DNA_ORIENTATION=
MAGVLGTAAVRAIPVVAAFTTGVEAAIGVIVVMVAAVRRY